MSLSFLIFSENIVVMSSEDSYDYDFGPSDFLPNKRYVITRYSKTNGMLESIITDEIYWITPVIKKALIKFNYHMPISVGPANADPISVGPANRGALTTMNVVNADPIVIDTDEKGEPKKISRTKLDLNDDNKINELREKWHEETAK